MGPINMLDALVEEHGPVVAFLVPCLALVASFFFLALLSGLFPRFVLRGDHSQYIRKY